MRISKKQSMTNHVPVEISFQSLSKKTRDNEQNMCAGGDYNAG